MKDLQESSSRMLGLMLVMIPTSIFWFGIGIVVGLWIGAT